VENFSKDNTGTAGNQDFKKRKISRNMHIIIEILVFIFLVGITAFLLQPLRLSILRQMTETRDYLIGEAEAFLGRKIEYASMGPSIFATLDIRDIRILNDDNEAVLTIGRLRLSYSFFALVMGEMQNSLKSIRIDMPVINMDSERDADLISLLFPDSQNTTQNIAPAERSWRGIDFLPDEIQVRIRSGSGTFSFGNNEVSVDGLSVDGNIQNRRIIFTSRWRAESVLSSLLNQNIQTNMSGEISGDFAADLSNGNLNLSIPSISGDLFTFKSITMNLAVSPDVIELRKIKDRSPYDLFVRYELDTNVMNAEFFADNFSPRDILSFNGDWSSYNEWLYAEASGFASLSRTIDGNIQYEVDLSGQTPSQLALSNLSFEIKSQGDSERADFFPLRFTFPQGELFFEGDVQFPSDVNFAAINGNLQVRNISLTGINPLNADFIINTYDNEINIFSETVTAGSLTLSAFDSYIINQENELSFTVSALRFQDIESYEDVSLSRVNLDGSYEFDPQHLQATFLLDSFSAADMLEALSPFVDTSAMPELIKNESANMLVTTEVFVTTDFEYVTYNAPRFVAAYSGTQDVLTLFSISGTDRRVEISNGSILAENTLGFSGNADFSDIDDISFSVQTVYDEYSYFVDGLFLDQRSLNLSGSYGFNAYLSLTDDGNYSGSIFADSIPIPFEKGIARVSVSTFVRWTDPDFWSVDLERLELANLPLPGNALGHFLIQGIADNTGATFSNIYFDDGRGTLTGTASADWESTFSTAAGTMILSDQSGVERYSAEARYTDHVFDASISVSRMQLGRFIENTGNITASADAVLHWSSAELFSLGLNISSFTGMMGTNPISAYARINADQDSAVIQNAKLFFGSFDIDLPFLEINLPESNLSASMNLRGPMIEKDIDAGFAAHASFNPIDSWLAVPEAIKSFQGSLDVQKFLVNTESPFEAFQFDFSRTETMLSVNGGPNNMIRFSISPEGDFYAGFSNPFPLRGSLIGNISEGQIDAHTSNLYIDMPALFAIIPDRVKKTIDVPSGFADASIQIKGSLSEPEFFGRVLGTSIRISLPQYLSTDIGPTPLLVTLEGTEMTFGPITTRVGEGLAEVSGYFLFNGWVPDTFTLDISVDEDHPIPYAFEQEGVKVRGDASGTIAINLENLAFDIQGDLVAYNTILTAGDLERAASLPINTGPDPRVLPALVNLNITSGPRVEFLFPNESFPIVRAYANLGSRITILADSGSGAFSLKGDVGLRGGDIYYINRSFYIREGEVQFDETELEFDPLITARANITEISSDGPVTISLILDNAPILSFTPRFESNPPLSQLEIMALLGQQDFSTGSSDPLALLSLIADPLSQFAVIQNLERTVRNFFRFDMFSIRTQLLQNALFLMSGISEPSTTSGSFGNYFDNTSVYIGKYITQDMFLQAMGSLRYDDMVDDLGRLRLEADIGLELNSPLADIRLNFVPLHPENMFIDDLSLTLSWKWTF
jgi:hypothetical protein